VFCHSNRKLTKTMADKFKHFIFSF
jgi:hypothetical protein